MDCFEANERAAMYERMAHHLVLLFDTHCFTLLVFTLSSSSFCVFYCNSICYR